MTANSEKQEIPSVEATVVRAVGVLRQSGNSAFYRLKRGTELLDAMLEPVFHETKAALRANKRFVSDELLAVSLLLLAKLDAAPGDVSLARALSIAEYSEIRFSGLIRCDDASELFTHLQRAVRFCGNRVNPFKLTQIVFGWTENRVAFTRKRMIADFYSFAEEPAA